MIQVNKPFLPPKQDYQKYLDDIWDRNWLTNDGPLVQELESQLKSYFGVSHLKYVSNGTVALQLAIKALGLQGEIITTPFSYVATTSSIVWEGCEPVFVDIDTDTLNIDVDKVEQAITPKTTAILATHVFGNPCNIEGLERIAKSNNIKLIFDAAHCFGSMYKSQSVMNFGDLSTISFHATKVFHTIEGGALTCQSPELARKINLMRNFGHDGPEVFTDIGINGKNSEVHASMGLVNLKYAEKILNKRAGDHEIYGHHLNDMQITRQKTETHSVSNNAYYPVIFDSEETCLRVVDTLESNHISPRRYFYPSLNKLDYTGSVKMPIAEDIASRILCLPLYFDLKKEEIELIAKTINQVL